MDTASFKESADDLTNRVGEKVEDAKQQLGRLNARLTTFIQAHPAACLLGAVALGYLAARVARHQH